MRLSDLSVFVKSTEILATAIESAARISTALKTCIVNGHDAHWTRYFLSQPYNVFTRIFVGSKNSMQDPICFKYKKFIIIKCLRMVDSLLWIILTFTCPKYRIAVNGNIKRMLRRYFREYNSMFSIQISTFLFKSKV